jgi:hypothetical protein
VRSDEGEVGRLRRSAPTADYRVPDCLPEVEALTKAALRHLARLLDAAAHFWAAPFCYFGEGLSPEKEERAEASRGRRLPRADTAGGVAAVGRGLPGLEAEVFLKAMTGGADDMLSMTDEAARIVAPTFEAAAKRFARLIDGGGLAGVDDMVRAIEDDFQLELGTWKRT